VARTDARNHSTYRHATGLEGVDLLLADFTSHEYAPHVHDSLVVAVTEVGGSEFKSRGRTERASPGALLVFNPGEPHSGRMAGSPRWRYRSLYFAAAGMARVLALLEADRPRYFTSNVIEHGRLVQDFLALHRVLGEAADPLLQQQLLVRCFTSLHGHGTDRPQGTKGNAAGALPARALDLMHQCHAQPLTLERIAAEAALPAYQLIEACKRATGLTPHAYLNQVRLRAALRALDAGRSLADAALAAGFYDQSALHRHFKRTFGMTPLQYVRETLH